MVPNQGKLIDCVGQPPTTVTSAWEETTCGEARSLGLMTSEVLTPDLSKLSLDSDNPETMRRINSEIRLQPHGDTGTGARAGLGPRVPPGTSSFFPVGSTF